MSSLGSAAVLNIGVDVIMALVHVGEERALSNGTFNLDSILLKSGLYVVSFVRTSSSAV